MLALIRLMVGIGILLNWNSGDSQELVVSSEDWVYEEQAISIRVEASDMLNAVSGRPHSLVIGVFQLSDPNTFSGLSVTRAGAVALLDTGRFDESIVGFERIVVRPGELSIHNIARSHRAQYVGLISGYFRLSPRQDVRIFAVPVVATNTEAKVFRAKPGKLFLNIKLGSTDTLQAVSLSGFD